MSTTVMTLLFTRRNTRRFTARSSRRPSPRATRQMSSRAPALTSTVTTNSVNATNVSAEKCIGVAASANSLAIAAAMV